MFRLARVPRKRGKRTSRIHSRSVVNSLYSISIISLSSKTNRIQKRSYYVTSYSSQEKSPDTSANPQQPPEPAKAQQQQQQPQQPSAQSTQSTAQQPAQQVPKQPPRKKSILLRIRQFLFGKQSDEDFSSSIQPDPYVATEYYKQHTLSQSLEYIRHEPDLYDLFSKFGVSEKTNMTISAKTKEITQFLQRLVDEERYYDVVLYYEMFAEYAHNDHVALYVTAISALDVEFQQKKFEKYFTSGFFPPQTRRVYFATYPNVFGMIMFFTIIVVIYYYATSPTSNSTSNTNTNKANTNNTNNTNNSNSSNSSNSNSSNGPLTKALSRMISTNFIPVENPTVKFTDVIGNDEAKADLFDIVEYLKDPDLFDFNNIKIPKGVLMTGPPGCGKTLLARSIAGEAGVNFFCASGSEFEEVFVGVGASKIRKLFQQARESQPCIIFIDEIDGMAPPRDKTNLVYASLNQLLVELDGFTPRDRIIVIGATNLLEGIDSALVRPGRFDRKVHLSLPHRKEREKLFDLYLKKQPLKTDPSVDIFKLAAQTQQMSGADINGIISWASTEAIKKDMAAITMDLIENALLNTIIGKEKKNTILTESERRRTAYHEGGHALVSILTEGANTIRKATITPRGSALGLVSHFKPDETSMSRQELIADIRVSLAGRIAEELIYGPDEVSSGAASDFEHATGRAKTMVYHAGMNSKVGKFFADDEVVGNKTRTLLEDEVSIIIESEYQEVKKLLTNNMDKLHTLARGLLMYNTLDETEINNLLAGIPLDREQEVPNGDIKTA